MSSAVASTKSGKVQGIKLETQYCGAEYYAFYGIPYAQPPIGDLRFKVIHNIYSYRFHLPTICSCAVESSESETMEMYSRRYERERRMCADFVVLLWIPRHWGLLIRERIHTKSNYINITSTITGLPTCWYDDTFCFKLPSKDEPLKAVMVNIPPGGLQCGSPDPSHQGNPDFIMHNDIVYVSICHRLHILGEFSHYTQSRRISVQLLSLFQGFLNLNMNECPGNMGLADMIMALEWVKENIQSFGGDPHNITAIGSSSGATMIHAFLLLPTVPGISIPPRQNRTLADLLNVSLRRFIPQSYSHGRLHLQ